MEPAFLWDTMLYSYPVELQQELLFKISIWVFCGQEAALLTQQHYPGACWSLKKQDVLKPHLIYISASYDSRLSVMP